MWSYTLLPEILNMSITGGMVILAVLLARLLLRRAPKVFSYALWAVVLFRLLCPVSLASPASLLNIVDVPAADSGRVEYIPPDIVHAKYPAVALPIPGVSEAINEQLPQGEEQLAADPLEFPMAAATFLWLTGVAAMLFYSAIRLVRLRRRLVGAVALRGNIYIADHIASPFVMGLFKPRIYLPSALSGHERDYIVLHEQYHIRRLDHIVKILAFLALCIHWFNPLVWLAFVLSGTDMEMSCDEAVMSKLSGDIRAEYSQSLLSLATSRRVICGTPLAFGEGDTRRRIVNVLRYRKPAFWMIAVAVAVCITVAVCLVTNPAKPPIELGSIQITWANALDKRPNEPTSRELNDAQLDEFKSRLLALEIGAKDSDLGGFTPLYSLSVQAQGHPQFMIAGYDTDGSHMALLYENEYYRLNDAEFSQYLRAVCAGADTAAAEEDLTPGGEGASANESTTLDAYFTDLVGVDAETKRTLYDYYRNVRYTPEAFDRWASGGITISIHAQRAFENGLLLLSYMYRGGEIGPELLYIRDGQVLYTTPSTDVWSVSYTRLLGNTFAFANSFAWSGGQGYTGYIPSTHVEAVFTDGQRDEFPMPVEAGREAPRGFIAMAEGETWLASLQVCDGSAVVADASELASSDTQPWWTGALGVRNYTRYAPMLPPGAWEAVQSQPMAERSYLRIGGERADWPNDSGVAPPNVRVLSRWDRHAELAFPDLWRNWNNYGGGRESVRPGTPIDLMNPPDAEVIKAYWVRLASDDGTQKGLDAAVTQTLPMAGTKDVWAAPAQPGPYLFALETADAYYTVTMEVAA